MRDRYILLTFDVEEFDTPLEYGHAVPFDKQVEVSTKGMLLLRDMMKNLNLVSTLFVTANYARQEKELIKELSLSHEIASHGLIHNIFNVSDLPESKKILESITGKTIRGFRRAQMRPVNEPDLFNAGYRYNSSLNPTCIPGRYNHLNKPKRPFVKNNIINVPASVSPLLRIPLFWLSFKNFPLGIYKYFSRNALRGENFLNIYFHPWEFVDLSAYRIPGFMKKHSKDELISRLHKYLAWLKKEGEFITMNDFCDQYKKMNPALQ